MSNSSFIRRSQLIAPFGVGAMIDFPDETLMSAGLDLWGAECAAKEKRNAIIESTRIFDERLQKLLEAKLARKISYFLMPSEATEGGFRTTKENSHQDPMPFVRFPTWCFCPRCKVMKQIGLEQSYTPTCNSDKRLSNGEAKTCAKLHKSQQRSLKPIRFLVACKNGHIDDFPWSEWVHQGKGDCNGASGDLFLKSTPATGLAGTIVHCSKCGVQRNMQGAFDPEKLKEVLPDASCTGRKPWLGSREPKDENCGADPLTIQRSSSNTYFAETISSILIPPYSKAIRLLIDKPTFWEEICEIFEDFLSEVDGQFRLDQRGMERLSKRADRHGVDVDSLYENALEKYLEQSSMSNQRYQESDEEFRYREYKALCGPRPEVVDRVDFDIENISISNYDGWFSKYFEQIVLVNQLRETRALIGFSRINPIDGGTEMSKLSRKPLNWLPAIENRGEGIFLRFNKALIDAWNDQRSAFQIAKSKSEKIKNTVARGAPNFARRDDVDEVFLLIHSFAHALIRRLSFECGYDSSALKERLFVSSETATTMNGLLIYTASGDSEGSLGGLVAQGKHGRLEQTVANALADSLFCSNDPVCLELKEQGHAGLNAAACHSCLLLPETCCEHNNLLLDRSALIGNVEEQGAFFDIADFT